MLPTSIINKLQQIASLHKYKEACGVVLSDFTIVCIPNVSKNPNAFIFSKKDWLTLLNNAEEIICVWHTHPYFVTPSALDISTAKRFCYPFLIVTGDDFTWVEI